VYRQGGVNFLVNEDPDSFAADFAAQHGPSACGFAVRFKQPVDEVYRKVLANGGEAVANKPASRAIEVPVVKGIGDCMLYLVDRYGDKGSMYEDYLPVQGAPQNPTGFGLTFIDHLTHNLYFGNMQKWSDYYERLFNFREIRYFDIQGEYTGLTSKALTAPDGKIRIPLNEESSKGSGQIEEFLMKFNGEGIQHIALLSDNLIDTIDQLGLAGVPLMTAPNDIYYEMLETRLPGHGQPVPELQSRGILLDGSTEGGRPRLLLQIFSQTAFGSPVFFEFIQRKGDDGFGEGNFKALFQSIERDQVRRGVLKTDGPDTP
jgi:4-hydroxyphenylpyruvate dioxygenase